MKKAHWLAVLLGAVVAGLTGVEGQLPPTAALIARLVVAVAGTILPMLAAMTPKASFETPPETLPK